MHKAIFLDRDGVICEDTHYISSINKLHIYDFAIEAIKLIKEKGYLALVISNQSGVARGIMTENDVNAINEEILRRTNIDKIYYCPHLPPDDIEVLPYRIHCKCRKPNIGMIEKANCDFDIDIKNSYFVGDRKSDIIAANKAKIQSVLVLTGKGNDTKDEISKDDLNITTDKNICFNFLYNNLLDFVLELN